MPCYTDTLLQGSRGVRAQISTVHPHWQLQHPGINDQDPYRSPGGHSLHFKGILTGCRVSILLPARSLAEGSLTHGLCTHPGSSHPWRGIPSVSCGPAWSSQGQGEWHPVPRITCSSALFAASSSFPPGRQSQGPGTDHRPALGVRALRAEPGSGEEQQPLHTNPGTQELLSCPSECLEKFICPQSSFR